MEPYKILKTAGIENAEQLVDTITSDITPERQGGIKGAFKRFDDEDNSVSWSEPFNPEGTAANRTQFEGMPIPKSRKVASRNKRYREKKALYGKAFTEGLKWGGKTLGGAIKGMGKGVSKAGKGLWDFGKASRQYGDEAWDAWKAGDQTTGQKAYNWSVNLLKPTSSTDVALDTGFAGYSLSEAGGKL